LNAEIEAALAAKSARDWSAILNKNGVPAGEVLDVPSVLEHPQIVERELMRTFAEPSGVGRPIQVVRSGFRLASGDPGPATPPPQLGADTNDILVELGYSKSEIDDLAQEKII
jgi:crotonobetainyl-CoA:carnitine CoA-transferase CaiB-like acyl-CoA transferase